MACSGCEFKASDLVGRLMRICPVLLVITIACARSSVPAVPNGEAAGSLGPGDAIMLYRSPCYAGCPVYSVRIARDGRVTYDGRARVSKLGTATAQVSPARVDALLEELETAGYFEFADRYRPSERACGRYVPDAPTVITSVRLGDRVKRIEHDYGCGGAPTALRVLESRIDEAVGSRRWTGR